VVGDPVRGPFLVVTRQGIFVTCLGVDMSPNDLPVIPRGQLDAQLAARSDYKERHGTFLRMAEERGGVQNVFSRLRYAGQHLTREEMTALSAIQPLFAYELLRLLVDVSVQLNTAREKLLPILQRAPKLRATEAATALLKDYTRNVYLLGHLSVLAGLSGPKLMEVLPEVLHPHAARMSFSWPGVRQGGLVHALRAAWLSGRIGRAQFALHKQNFAGGGSVFTAFDPALALTAIAFRHARYRAEVQKLMRAALQAPGNKYRWDAAALGTVVLEATPEELDEPLLELGRHVVLVMAQAHSPPSPFAFRHKEDIPADLARTAVVNATDSFVDREDVRLPMFASLGWMGRAAPEDLYFPRAFIEPLRSPFDPESAYRLLRPMAEMYKNEPQRPTGTRRQGPCPCGSGKKYKRCCEEKDAAKKAAAEPKDATPDTAEEAEEDEPATDRTAPP
jgi:hypothetical protein